MCQSTNQSTPVYSVFAGTAGDGVTMALTGERLHQLLHANAVRRKQKRRSNRQTSITTGEEDDEEEEPQHEADRDRKSLENGQYIGCYVVASRGSFGKGKWMKPYSGQREPHTTATSDLSQSTTYTACVTEDLAFKKLLLEELPSSVRRPRSASLSIYVLDDDLTQWIVCRDSREHSRKASKLPEEALVPRRKRSIRDDIYYGLDYHDVLGSVPPIPPKPDNLSAQPPSLTYTRARDARETGQSTDDERPSDPAPNRSPRPLPSTPQEPALPLPPRKNRPLPPVDSTRQNGYLGTVSGVTRPHEPKFSRAISEPANHEDDDGNHYEALDSKILEANKTPEANAQGNASSSGKGSPDTASIDERHESDSVFDKSNDLSYTGSSSDLDNSRTVPPYDEPYNQEGDAKPPKNPAPRVPLSPLLRGTASGSSQPARPEIALPKMSRERFEDSDSSETDTYEPIEVRGDPFEADGSPSRYGAEHEEGPGDSSWLLIRRDDIVIVETAAVYNAPLALSETESDDDMAQHVHSENSHEQPQSDSLIGFLGTSLCYDKDGNAIYVPTDRLKPYGDPRGQPWFYPLDLSSREATLFLRGEQQEGCFLVYRPSANGVLTAAYNLSVSHGNGDVLHYHILEGPEGGVTVEGHDHSFLNLADLVDYFRRNKSTLATRLRRPLKEARLPITAGYHYDLAYELDRNRLSLSGSIIGKGNFGVVCSGTYGTTQVAVKVLQGTETSLEEEDDFIEEARVLMLLRHEHVVKIIGVSSSARPFFLVTEFIRNGNLKECLRAGRIPPNNPEILVSICLQMLAALSYLESVKVILHRDVAARNFLVADLKCIKLADFGRARYVSDDNYQAPRTEKISIKWAAPEVLVDFRYSTKSDVWATGVAMWEVYSVGERPYESLSAEQTAVYVTEGGRLARPALCPEEMYSAVRRCWRRSPASRPSSADLHQTIVENRCAAIYRRNQKSNSAVNPTITVSVTPRPSVNPPTTPVMSKKALKNGGTRSGKQRFSSLREALTYVSSKDGDQSIKKTNSNERLPNSSSSDNVSLPSTPDPTASQRIRSSFRKLIITKKIRNNSKSKADYLQNNGKPCTITEL